MSHHFHVRLHPGGNVATVVELLLRGLGLHMSDEDYEATMRHLDDVVAGSE